MKIMKYSERQPTRKDYYGGKLMSHIKYGQYKRFIMRKDRNARRNAVSYFKFRNNGKTVATHQYWVPGTQWGDFQFIHPTKHTIVTVYARTLAMAYNDACEEEADRLTADLDFPSFGESINDMFVPVYKTVKGSKRPRVSGYKFKEELPDVKASRIAYFNTKVETTTHIMNSGTISVSEEVKVRYMPHGLFVNLIIDLPELRETDFQTMQDLAIGVTKPKTETKTFTRAQLLSIFNYDEDTLDNVKIIQPLSIKIN